MWNWPNCRLEVWINQRILLLFVDSLHVDCTVGSRHRNSFSIFFAISILHSRESELHRYVFGRYVRTRLEVAFSEVSEAPVFQIKVGSPVKCLAQGHKKRTCWFVLHNLPQMPSAKPGSYSLSFSKVCWYDSTKRMNSKSTDCEADAQTNTPSRRFTPDHWNIKAVCLSILFCPLSKMFNTLLAYNMGCTCLILITQHYFEVSKLSTLQKFTDTFPVGLQRIFSAYIAKHIWIV